MPSIRIIAAALVALCSSAAAQDWPTRPVTMVVPFAAGGAFDVLARVFAPHLSMSLGQQVIVENVGAAAGIVGTNRVAKATPDGYVFLFGSVGTHAYNQTLYKKLPYNAATDFAGVHRLCQGERREAAIRLGRRGLHDPPQLRAAQYRGRARHHPCALSRRRTGDGGFDRRANPLHVLQ